MKRWRWAILLLAAIFTTAVKTQTPTTTTDDGSVSSAVSLAGSGTASPIPDSCPSGTGQQLVASDNQEYVLVCSIDYPNNDLVAYNADSISDCIETCESVNNVYPNDPCVGITYSPTIGNGYSCHVKYKFGNSQRESYQVDTAILLQGVKASAATTPTSATTTSSSASSTATNTPNDGCPATNGTILHSLMNETYYLYCNLDFPNNRIGDVSGTDMQECIQQCSYANQAVGNGTC